MTVCDKLFDTSYAKFSQEIIEENGFNYYLYGYCEHTFIKKHSQLEANQVERLLLVSSFLLGRKVTLVIYNGLIVLFN